MSKFRKRWLIGAFVVSLIAGAGAIAWRKTSIEGGPKAAAPIEFIEADFVRLADRRIESELIFPGDAQAISQATVRSKLSAEVQRVLVREGDRVTAGQLLAEFDTSSLRTLRAERVAVLEAARANLAQSERTRETNAELLRRNFISRSVADSSDDALRAQQAQVTAAQAQLAQIELQLADAQVRSPIAGQVARRLVQPGEKLAFDTPMLTLVDLAELEIVASAPVSDAAMVTPGLLASIEIEGMPDRRFEGRVDRISPAAEQSSRTLRLYLRLRNERAGQDWLLKAGMFARVHLRVGSDATLPTLPLAALRNDDGASSVWVLADGKLARRSVTVGRRDERAQLVEIRGGVTAADRVLATKFDNLRDGLAARIVPAVK